MSLRLDIVRMYESGAKIREISEALGCSDTSIYWNLDKAGVRRRQATGPRKVAPETAAAIRADYESNMTIKALCEKYDIGKKTVARAVLQAGGEMRSRQRSLDITVRDSIGRRKTIEEQHGDEIVRLYADVGLSQTAIAERLGVSQGVVSRVVRSRGVSKPALRGRNAPGWRGGRIRNPYGYVMVMVYDEDDDTALAMRNANGYALEHRLVMARAIGRPLREDETVHHINGRRDDNRIGNLQLRQGKHGKGASFTCLACGSHNVAPAPIKEEIMSRYACAECGTPAIVSLGVVTRVCDCDAAVVAEASVTLVGEGGIA